MPQVDLETLVSVCGASDNKVASVVDDPEPDHVPPRPSDNDPPGSFWLSKDAEFDWFDRNAVVLDRRDSTKGNSNANSTPSHHSSQQHQQRLPSLKKSKASILALPKPSKSQCRRNLTRMTLFPKRSAKAAEAQIAEPSSPKVSCMGRVRSKRDKNRQLQQQQQQFQSKQIESSRSESVERRSGKRVGFWKIVFSIFRPKSSERKSSGALPAPPAAEPVRKIEQAVEPVGLGGMKRSISGRRSDSWIGDLDDSEKKENPVEAAAVKSSEDCGPGLWSRRSDVGPLKKLNCGERDLSAAGPASA